MTKDIVPGGNAPVAADAVVVKIELGGAADVSSFRLHEDGKTRIDEDFIFYGQKQNDDGTVALQQSGNTSDFYVKLASLKPAVQKIAFTATVDSGTVSSLQSIQVSVMAAGSTLVTATVPVSGRQEKALILGELYLRNGSWKYRNISQGFNGGLQPLAEHFGVDIADDSSAEPAPAPTPAPVPPPASNPKPVNLSKVSLTKSNPTVSLEKKASGYGLIKVNLNWTQKTSGGFFGSRNIDLDLGAFVRMKDGNQTVVQALGDMFGRINNAPFVELQGDDRTGRSTGGEWIHINGDQWQHLDEVLIYTFIYEGAANWVEANAYVNLYAPDQPPIETRLTEGQKRYGMCAIARLVNDGGKVRVERLDTYHSGHDDMDKCYGWGFRWKAGSK